jgi:redox-sensitive bicupin YhaK (pirin superfamily)
MRRGIPGTVRIEGYRRSFMTEVTVSDNVTLILGGQPIRQPIREPVAAPWPFVMNTRDELMQAFEDHRAGRLDTVPADHIGPA